MKIYTKTGDKGKTSLFGGTKVSKNHIRLNAYGTIDELNSFAGLVRDVLTDENQKNTLLSIQQNLFVIASELASENESALSRVPKIELASIEHLEKEIDKMDAETPPLKSFILPGGHVHVSYCHISRTVCRRAERNIIQLSEEIEIDEIIVVYLNRLSDYFFMLARKLAVELQVEEVKWKGNH